MSRSGCPFDEITEIERLTQERVDNEHRLDNIYMLTYTILLALSVLTIWLFKHRRFRFIHETGLSIIYGLIVGAIFTYGFSEQRVTSQVYDLSKASANDCTVTLPPEKATLRLTFLDENVTYRYYHYSLDGQSNVKEVSHYRMTFNPEIFFNVILPPIIFSAGYSMKRGHFFRNFGAIINYAFLGTVMSSFITASLCFGFSRFIPSLNGILSFSDCLYFGTMISATDTVTVLTIFHDLNVDVDMFALVFGESVLNDAVVMALSKAVDKYESMAAGVFTVKAVLLSIGDFLANFGSSFVLGSAIGCFTALITKYTHIRDYPLLETSLFVLLSYSTFFLCEAFGFTGIVALLFCGVTQAHYTYNNLSRESQTWTKQVFELLNFVAENFVFAYIGVSTFSFRSHNWNPGFIFITILACIASRVLAIYPLTAVINCVRRHQYNGCSSCCNRHRIGSHSLSVRGGDLIGTVSGSGYKWARFVGTPTPSISNVDADPSLNPIVEPQQSQVTNHISWNMQHLLVFCGLRGALAFSLAIRNTSTPVRQMFFSTTIIVVMITVFMGGCLVSNMLQWLKIPTNVTHVDQSASAGGSNRRKTTEPHHNSCWHRFDVRYLKPFLTHSGPLLSETLPRCCLCLANWLTTSDQRENVMSSYEPEPEAGFSGTDSGDKPHSKFSLASGNGKDVALLPGTDISLDFNTSQIG